LDAVRFEFEKGVPRRLKRLWSAANGSVAFQIELIETHWRVYVAAGAKRKVTNGWPRFGSAAAGPEVVRPRAYVDLGHHNLYFVEGLLAAYRGPPRTPRLSPATPRLRFVRIRRGRFESTVSWCSSLDTIKSKPARAWYTLGATERERDRSVGGAFFYSPHLGYPVQLAVSQATWRRLTLAQKVMWFIDEVEARWQALLARGVCESYVDAPACVELTWTKYAPAPDSRCGVKMDSYATALSRVARFMGLRPSEERVNRKRHTAVSSGTPIGTLARVARFMGLEPSGAAADGQNRALAKPKTAAESMPLLVGQHEGYMAIMRFNASALRMIRVTVDCW
jgi:hypothetical protein